MENAFGEQAAQGFAGQNSYNRFADDAAEGANVSRSVKIRLPKDLEDALRTFLSTMKMEQLHNPDGLHPSHPELEELLSIYMPCYTAPCSAMAPLASPALDVPGELLAALLNFWIAVNPEYEDTMQSVDRIYNELKRLLTRYLPVIQMTQYRDLPDEVQYAVEHFCAAMAARPRIDLADGFEFYSRIRDEIHHHVVLTLCVDVFTVSESQMDIILRELDGFDITYDSTRAQLERANSLLHLTLKRFLLLYTATTRAELIMALRHIRFTTREYVNELAGDEAASQPGTPSIPLPVTGAWICSHCPFEDSHLPNCPHEGAPAPMQLLPQTMPSEKQGRRRVRTELRFASMRFKRYFAAKKKLPVPDATEPKLNIFKLLWSKVRESRALRKAATKERGDTQSSGGGGGPEVAAAV